MMLLSKKIYLASNSPRRKELLGNLGLSFEIKQVDVDESYEGIALENVSAFLARKKAQACEISDALVLCADTVVLCGDALLGKPEDRTEAIHMLEMLSGNTHRVSSSVCLRDGMQYFEGTDVAEVKFRTLSEQEIVYYVDTYQPFDKAGAYGIQEWIGMVGVEEIKGSFYTIMGLPTHLVYRLLLPYVI